MDRKDIIQRRIDLRIYSNRDKLVTGDVLNDVLTYGLENMYQDIEEALAVIIANINTLLSRTNETNEVIGAANTLLTNNKILVNAINESYNKIISLESRVNALEHNTSPDIVTLTGNFLYSKNANADGETLTPTNTLSLIVNGVAQQVVFTYTLNNTEYASVDSNGRVTFISSKETNVRSVFVTVKCIYNNIEYTQMAVASQDAYVADTVQLIGSLVYNNDAPSSGGTLTPTNTLQLLVNGVQQPIAFSYSSSENYATVNSSGKVTFTANSNAARNTIITATCTYEGIEYSTTAIASQNAYVAPTYSITRNLSGVNSSNTSNTITEGNSYTTTLSLVSGYQNMSVSVTMGGTDITSSALNDNIVSIVNVTGNIVITASATLIPVEVNYIYAGSVKNMTSDPITINQFTAGASTTSKTIDYIPTEVVNTIIAVCPSTMNLTSCIKHGEIEEVITSEMLASVSNVTYDSKPCKMYQFKFGVSIKNVAFTITFN